MKTIKRIYNRIPDILFGKTAERATVIVAVIISAWATIIVAGILLTSIF